MNGFEKLEKKYRKLDVNRILREVWRNPTVQEFIIKLNTEDQLYDKGEDSLGVELGNYTPISIQLKLAGSGDKRIDHITLKDTGEFYESFKVFALLNGFRLTADPDKGGGDVLTDPPPDGFGDDIIGINEENLLKLCAFIHPFFIMEAKKALS